MNLKKDINDELIRQAYLKKADFYSVLYNDQIVYSEKLEKLIELSKELTLLSSTLNTVAVLLENKTDEQDGNIS